MMKGVGIAGAGVTAALGINKIIQNAGEQIQQYRNLGAESGGGAAEGAGFEIQARMMAINPFLTLEQSRSIMQTALKNGYTGKEFDTVSKMMAENLKDMNMSSAQSMDIWMSTVEKGKVSVKDFGDQMDRLKDLTRLDGNKLGQTERNQQYQQTVGALQSLGLEGQNLTSTATAITEAYSDNQQLKSVVPQATLGGLQDPTFLMYMAQANNIRGVGDPEEVLLRIQDQGINTGEAVDKTYARIAKMAKDSAHGDPIRGAIIFHRLLGQFGINMDVASARELYNRVTGDRPDAFRRGQDKAVAAAMDPGTIGEQVGNLTAPLQAPLDLVRSGFDFFTGRYSDAWSNLKNAGHNLMRPIDQIEKSFAGPEDVARAEIAARQAAGSPGSNSSMPNNGPGTGSPVSSTVNGQVNGELRIVVDRDGNVHAPNSIQLSGQQKGVNAGYGSGTLNNPSPGDPTFDHSYVGWQH